MQLRAADVRDNAGENRLPQALHVGRRVPQPDQQPVGRKFGAAKPARLVQHDDAIGLDPARAAARRGGPKLHRVALRTFRRVIARKTPRKRTPPPS